MNMITRITGSRVKVQLHSIPQRCDTANSAQMEEVWKSKLQGVQSYGAYGPRDVLIIRSSETLEGPDIVPRKKGTLIAEDYQRLTSQDIPVECWGDDAKLMEVRYRREEERYNVLPMECGDGLTSQSVMDRIREIMKNTDKPGGENHDVCLSNCLMASYIQLQSTTLALARR